MTTQTGNFLDLVLIRHGESQQNRDGTGGLDSPLTELGVLQAQRLAQWLPKNYNAAILYASPLIRARHTAELIAPSLGLPVVLRDELREMDFDLTDMFQAFPDPAQALGASIPVDRFVPQYVDFQARVTGAFRNILAAHQTGTLVVVTHGGVISTFVRTVFGAHQASVSIDNTSVTHLRWRNSRWYLMFTNRLEHLNCNG